MMAERDFEEWLAKQPERIHATARRFPPGTQFYVGTDLYYAIGYEMSDDDVWVRISIIDPAEDFQKARVLSWTVESAGFENLEKFIVIDCPS
jgi:hypothetical protein